MPDGDPQSGAPSVLRDLEGVAVGPSGVKSRLGRRARQHQSHALCHLLQHPAGRAVHSASPAALPRSSQDVPQHVLWGCRSACCAWEGAAGCEEVKSS